MAVETEGICERVLEDAVLEDRAHEPGEEQEVALGVAGLAASEGHRGGGAQVGVDEDALPVEVQRVERDRRPRTRPATSEVTRQAEAMGRTGTTRRRLASSSSASFQRRR